MLLEAKFPGEAEFKAVLDAEISRGGLLVRGATVANVAAGSACTLKITVGERQAVEVAARVAAVVPGVGVAVMLDGVPESLKALAEVRASSRPVQAEAEAEADEEPAPSGTLYDRLKAMSVNEKMQLALSGTRDERMALFRDNNKMLHQFVLKNPRVGLDEVQYAAKLPGLSPDALKQIGEHKDWGQNPQVVTGLVRNPRTPIPLALRLLDKVPLSELRAIAKGGARDQIVHAAKKKVAG